MNTRFKVLFIALLLLPTTTLQGQESSPDEQNDKQTDGSDAMAMQQTSGGDSMSSGQMTPAEQTDMWKSLTSMSKQCEAMMQGEMAWRPLKISAVILVGAVAVAALVLLIILEIQTIRWLGLRIKHEREAGPSSKR